MQPPTEEQLTAEHMPPLLGAEPLRTSSSEQEAERATIGIGTAAPPSCCLSASRMRLAASWPSQMGLRAVGDE